MKITFVLPGIWLVGGVKVVFEYANRLQERGHEVCIVYPIIPLNTMKNWYDVRNLEYKVFGTLLNLKRGNTIDWFDLKATLIGKPTLNNNFIPEGDIVVATAWKTAYDVAKYDKNRGKKFYLIQHYEIWSGEEEVVDTSYKLGLRNIVISTWIKNILEKKLGAKIESLIINGMDFNQFYQKNLQKNHNGIKILMPYRKDEWKGASDGVKAFEIINKKYNNVKLIMFGPSGGKDIPKYAEFHERITTDELRDLYCSCDIFMFPSRCEGFGLPPMEAMACGCAVVTTNVGAIPDIAIPGKTVLVSPPNDPEALAKNVIELIDNKEKLKQIADSGCDYIKQFTWDKATDKLENLFLTN